MPVAISGANFGVAETGSIAVVESEGNGRMCTTLPRVLITLMGIEKVLPEWRDLEVMLQLLPRSSTAERMNPYTSIWTGVREGDGPQEFHLVLLDAGRSAVLADEVGRQALHCIRCSACLNVCPVYSRVGGHAYESVYPGPIGAILTPQLAGPGERADAALGVVAVRRLLRGLPGQDRHPDRAGAPARPCRARGQEPLEPGAPCDGRARARVRAHAGTTSARSGWRGSATARSRGCLARWAAGPRCATSPTCPGRRSATGGRNAIPARPRRPARPATGAAPRPARPRERRGPMTARAEILARIGAALGAGVAVPEVPRDYNRAGAGAPAGDEAVVARFCERAAEYRATVRRVGADAVEAAVAEAAREHGARRLAVPPGGQRHVPGVELLVDDPPISAQGLDRVDGVLTGCALAIAETGTIVLDSGAESGRRAITLVPDLHICLVDAARIHASVPDAVTALAAAAAEGRPITFVSGPSATSDIELERVEGVHGPRDLVILVVAAPGS